jgi:hypothetical protein
MKPLGSRHPTSPSRLPTTLTKSQVIVKGLVREIDIRLSDNDRHDVNPSTETLCHGSRNDPTAGFS